MNKKLNVMYFSATNTTKMIVSGLANNILENMNSKKNSKVIDFTLPKGRNESVTFTKEDVVIIGVPVYAGRVPNVLLKYLNTIEGMGALAIPIVVYGNRNYDDALIEMKDFLESNGFRVIAAGAFIGEHSFSNILAKGRPDEKDMGIVKDFAKRIYEKLENGDELQPITVKGNKPYRSYYMPKNEAGNPVDIRKVTPRTSSECIDCKLCVEHCPMGSIDPKDVSKLIGICIKCGACIKKCPVVAKYYDSIDYLRHKEELEVELVERRSVEVFL